MALHHYLSWHSIVPAPRTVLRGVRKLPPATLRVIEADGRSREEVYWRPDYVREPADAGMDAADWRAAIGDALRAAVRRRLVADVPVGVLLSGGLDSSLIVALLAEAGQQHLRTFSIGFDSRDGESGDEFHYSDLVARAYDTDHHRIRLADDDLVPAVRRAVLAMTEPMGSHDVVAFHLLSEQVAQHVKVAQSGQGADEVFAGYGYHQPLVGAPRHGAAETFAAAFFDRDHDELRGIVGPAYALEHDASRELLAEHLAAPGAQTALDAVLRLDTHLMLPDDPVKRVDSMSMAWGLEVRTPFLDQDLVTLAAHCPPEHKVAQGGKGVLKEVAREVLPAEVIDRPKGYFPVPALRNVDGPVRELVAEALQAPAARERGLFRPEYVAQLLAEPDRARRRPAATSCGSSACWSCGSRPTTSADRRPGACQPAAVRATRSSRTRAQVHRCAPSTRRCRVAPVPSRRSRASCANTYPRSPWRSRAGAITAISSSTSAQAGRVPPARRSISSPSSPSWAARQCAAATRQSRTSGAVTPARTSSARVATRDRTSAATSTASSTSVQTSPTRTSTVGYADDGRAYQ